MILHNSYNVLLCMSKKNYQVNANEGTRRFKIDNRVQGLASSFILFLRPAAMVGGIWVAPRA